MAVEAAERVAARTCLAEGGCAGVALAVAGSLGPKERSMMMERWAVKSLNPTFATDTYVSYSGTNSQLQDAITPEALQGRRYYSTTMPETEHKPVADAQRATLWLAQDELL